MQVEIDKARHIFYEPNVYKKGAIIKFEGIPLIACNSYSNTKSWTIKTIDPDYGTEIANVSLAGLETDQAELSLPRWTLDYGLYKVEFNMRMDSPNPKLQFTRTDYSYFRVEKSELVGMVVAGGSSEITRGTGSGNLLLEPLKFSYDPDVLDDDPATSEIKVASWTCEKRNISDPYTPAVNCAAAITSGSICRQLEQAYLVLQTERLGLRAACTNCLDTDTVTYEWTFYLDDYRWTIQGGWRPLQTHELQARTVGSTSSELAILADMFAHYSDVSKFKVECAITRNGATGKAATVLVANKPPYGGNCSITPNEAVVTEEKVFRIVCENWADDSGIEVYEFFSYHDNTSVNIQITSEKTSSSGVDVMAAIGQGAPFRDYYTNVKVVVRDIYGASTVYEIGTVRVMPKPLEESRRFISEMKRNSKSVMQRKIAEGNVKDLTEFASSMAAIINSDKYLAQTMPSFQSSTMLSNYDSDRVGAFVESTTEVSIEEEMKIETERDTRAGLRRNFMEALSELPRNDVLSEMQILSAMTECTKFQDEVDTATRDLAMDTLLGMGNNLNASQEDITPEQRKTRNGYMLSLLGNIVSAAGTTGFHGTLTEQEQAFEDPMFMDYDVNNVAVSDDCLLNHPRSGDIDEAVRNHKILTNCKMTRARNKELQEKTARFMQNLKKNFMDNTILGESEMHATDHQRTALVKTEAQKILEAPFTLDNSDVSVEFTGSFSDAFPSGLLPADAHVVLEVTETSNFPARYSAVAKNLGKTTEFVTISLSTYAGPLRVNGMKKPLKFVIPRDKKQPRLAYKDINPKLASWNEYQLHETEIEKDHASLHVGLCIDTPGVQFAVVFSFGERPNHHEGRCNASYLVPPDINNWVNCSRVYMDNLQVNNYKGKVYIGVRQLMANETNMNLTDCQLPDYWSNGTKEAQFTTNYTLQLFTSGCYSISEGDSDWTTDGLRVSHETDDTKTVCESTHLTTFAGGWVVAPNTIDWNYVFSNMDFLKNPTLYVTEIVIAVVYIIALIWARRKDKKDVEQLGIAPLMDNDPKDKYYYEIVVVTGMRRNAGTDSKVFFILSGEEDETDVRQFTDSKRKIFRRGATNGFLMATTRPLGYLNYARVWHDNSGKGKFGGWYLNYMIVRDVQTDEKWVFIADRWFAVEEDDGMVDRIIPAATRDRMTEFGHLFAERSRKNLADGHLWFSVVARPPQSRFTAVQRVTCCLCLLYTSMLANAMFYRTDGNTNTGGGFTIGPFSLTPEQVFIGVVSNLIVFPVNFIVITLFRKSRPRRMRPSRVDEAIKTAYETREASVNDVKPEVGSIFTMSRASSVVDPKRPDTSASISRPGTSLSTRADATLPTKKKKKSLPWWCRIVAWTILWIAIIVSAAFVTFYGVSFADETCKKWISSMLISFFMSVFITQPIKVFLVAIFLSLIIKNPGEEEEEDEAHDEETTKLANDEIPLHTMNDAFGHARPRKIGYKPPDRAELEAAREKRLKEIQMWSVVREVIVYAFFLWILLVISYRNRNANTFLYKDTMERVFIKNNLTDVDFEKVRNAEEYWTWTRSGLVNGIRPGPYYNNYPPLMLRGFTNDKVSKILGYATLRQLRIKPNLCEMDPRVMDVVRECNVGYEIRHQEEGTFDIGWKPQTANSTTNDTAEWYRYRYADELNGYPYWGQLAMYAGGGYLVKLEGSKEDLIELMNRLEREEWIDRYTRAVIVEFTTYNAQVNLFGIATIIAEFHSTGGIVQTYRFEPALLLPYMTSAMLFQLVCEGVYVAFIVFFMVRLIRTFIKEKLSFFKGFWNFIELGIIGMSLGGIVIYFYRMYETNKLTNQFKETNGLGYIKFQYVGYWNEIFGYMIGCTVFFATLKFLRLLRFNKRMSLLAATLRNGARSLIHFSIIFWIVFLAFSMLFYLTFMNIDIKYSSFVSSVVAGILMMMGKFDIYQMIMAEPVLTQLFVFGFVLSVTFVIVNMFVSILNETFASVRNDINKQSNDYEIVSFMLSRFKRFTGMGGTQPTTLSPEELQKQEREKQYATGNETERSCVDDFPDRIDRLLHSISNVYMDQDGMAAMLDKKGYQASGGKGGYHASGGKGGYPGSGDRGNGRSESGARGRVSEMSKVHTH
nr:hypothetical protein BaRGS_023146 [Batillaria attramentaria]